MIVLIRISTALMFNFQQNGPTTFKRQWLLQLQVYVTLSLPSGIKAILKILHDSKYSDSGKIMKC